MKNIYPFALFSLLLAACNSTDDFNLTDNETLEESVSYSTATFQNNNQQPCYEGLWKIETYQGIQAILLSNGVYREKKSDDTSFGESTTYEVKGTFSQHKAGNALPLTILAIHSDNEQEPQKFIGLSPFERNDSVLMRIYTFKDNPLLNKAVLPEEFGCFAKIGDVYQPTKSVDSDSNSSSQIQNRTTQMPKIKFWYFFAVWSGPCRIQTPINYEFVNNNHPGDIEYTKIDVDDEQDLAEQYKIMNVPTMLFLNIYSNNVVATIVGVRHIQDLELMYSVLI